MSASSDLPPAPIDPVRGAPVASPRARRFAIIAAGVIAMGIGTVPAVRQLPAPTPVPTWPMGSANWWRYPVERNSAQRMYVTPGPLSAVFAIRGTDEVWFAGDGGLLIHSTDAGRTWRDTNLKALYLPSSTTPPSLAPRTSRARRVTPSLFIPASFVRPARGWPYRQALDTAYLRVPSLLRQSFTNAVAILARSRLRARLVAGDSSGLIIRQSPSEGVLISAGGTVDLWTTSVNSRIGDASGVAQQIDSNAPVTKSLPVRKLSVPSVTVPSTKAASTKSSSTKSSAIKPTPAKAFPSTPVRTDTVSFYPRFSAICFASTQVGWVAGDHGAIFSTMDGGDHWTQRVGPAKRVAAVACDAKMGAIAVGDSESVLLPLNGGAQVRSSGAALFQVAIGTGGTIWASQAMNQQTRIVRSVDNGTTWRPDSSFPNRNGNVAFADSLDGMISGDTQFGIRTSNDGGQKWSSPKCGSLTQADSANHLVSLTAANAVSAIGIDYRHRVWATSDAWRTCQPGTRLHGGLARVSPASSALWYAADSGALLSRDGGHSWHSLINAARFSTIAFADSLHGWAGMENGEVARTSNAGRTWNYSSIDTLLHDPVIHIAHKSPSDLFASVGGRSYSSTDRGATWQRVAGADSSVVALFFQGDSLGWGMARNAIVVTRDGGRSWSSPDTTKGAYHGLRTMPGGARAIGITADTGGGSGAMWATAPDGRLYRYAGAGWDTIQTTPLLAALPVKGRFAYGLDARGELIHSTDDGRTWVPAGVDPPHKYPAPWYYAYLLACVGATIAASRVQSDPVRKPAASIADILVPDRPLREGDRDVLAFARIAGGLSRFIQNARTEPPLTIAITGEWGTGKSSLMNLLRRDLELRKYRTIWFNAWHHQREESLLASLLESIRRTATPPMWTWRGIRFRARLLWSRIGHFAVPMLAVIPAFAFAVGYILADPAQRWGELVNGTRLLGHYLLSLVDTAHGTAAGASAATGVPDTPHLGQAPGTLLAAIVSIVGTMFTFTKGLKAFGVKPDEVARSAMSAGQVQTIAVPPAFRYLFARDFREVTEALKPERLVIFVDDLDRCKPDQVLEILEAINFLTESGDCIVVLGIDRERVTGCVAIGFKEVASMLTQMQGGDAAPIAGRANAANDAANVQNQIDYARHYLEKLLNMEIAIPATTAAGLGRVMTKSATPVASAGGDEAIADRQRKLKALKRNMVGATMVMLTVITFLGGFLTTSTRQKFAAAPFADVTPVSAAVETPVSAPLPGLIAHPQVTLSESEFANQQARVSLTHGTAPTTASWLYLALALGAAGLLVWFVTPTYHDRIDDSADFTDALLAWAPVLYESLHTPRAAKKFLNRVRFLAMSQRLRVTPRSPLERLRDWFANLRGKTPSTIDTTTLELQPDAIPEATLVSLCVIAEGHPAWLNNDYFWTTDLRTSVVSSFQAFNSQPMPANFVKAFDTLDTIAKDDLAPLRPVAPYKNTWHGFANWSNV